MFPAFSQLYFFNSRLTQLDTNNLSPDQTVIADYIFEKELIYAKKLLNDDQFVLYEKLHSSHSDCVAAAQLIIYLSDTAENCLNRIQNRNRPYEQKIDPQFLNSLIIVSKTNFYILNNICQPYMQTNFNELLIFAADFLHLPLSIAISLYR